jgi:hypothetical protein
MSESSALNTFIELIKRSENEITKKILSIRDEMKEKEIEGLMFYFQKLLSECNQHIANQYDLLYGNACLLSLLLLEEYTGQIRCTGNYSSCVLFCHGQVLQQDEQNTDHWNIVCN